jgi:hypothetical protein
MPRSLSDQHRTGRHQPHGGCEQGRHQFEACDIASKVYFEFKNASKTQIKGPVWAFPSAGGIYGSIASTANDVTQSIVNNGAMGMSRKLRLPILVARSDNLEATIGIAGSASLVFRTADGAGAATLVTVMLGVLLR